MNPQFRHTAPGLQIPPSGVSCSARKAQTRALTRWGSVFLLAWAPGGSSWESSSRDSGDHPRNSAGL